MKKTAEVIKMPVRASRPVKIRRLNSIEIIRRDVLGIYQREVRDILGFTQDKSVSEMENADTDRLTIDHLRALRAYARENGIAWPANLVERLLDHDPASGESPIKKRKKAAEG